MMPSEYIWVEYVYMVMADSASGELAKCKTARFEADLSSSCISKQVILSISCSEILTFLFLIVYAIKIYYNQLSTLVLREQVIVVL